MKVLIVGGGGREHAMAWKAAASPLCDKLYCAPGNGGTAALAENVEIDASDVGALAAFARGEGIDLTLVGPEAPLTAGIVDRFEKEGLAAFGPCAAAARLEGSKSFAKRFMDRHGIPTARWGEFTELEPAFRFIDGLRGQVVVKADGLAAGKGVHVAEGADDAKEFARTSLQGGAFGEAGARLVVEERLEGEELSVLALCDGERAWPLVASQDHKRAGDGDTGPNTGGMGAYAPVSLADDALMERIRREALDPVMRGMKEDGTPFKGVLYAGLMLTAEGPKVLEYNARFGDPEAQAVLSLLDSDLLALCRAACSGEGLKGAPPKTAQGAAVCVVMASGGYPGPFRKGFPIEGLDEAARVPGVTVFHAGTALKDGRVVTSGGRVLGVTARGATVREAAAACYEAAERIRFEGAVRRNDIAWREMARIRGK